MQSRNSLFLWKNEGQHSLQKSPSIFSLFDLKYLIHIFTSSPYFYGSPQKYYSTKFQISCFEIQKMFSLLTSWQLRILYVKLNGF